LRVPESACCAMAKFVTHTRREREERERGERERERKRGEREGEREREERGERETFETYTRTRGEETVSSRLRTLALARSPCTHPLSPSGDIHIQGRGSRRPKDIRFRVEG